MELDSPYDIKLVFVQKITFLSKKNQQKLLRPELHFFTPICTKSFVGWGFAPDPNDEDQSAPPDPLPVFRGPTSKGKAGEWRKGEGESKGKERKGRGRGQEERGWERGSSLFALGKNVGAYAQNYSQTDTRITLMYDSE